MKKYIIIRIISVILLSAIALVCISGLLLFKSAESSFEENSNLQINELLEVFTENKDNVALINSQLQDEFLIRTETLAYLLHEKPSLLDDHEKLIEVADVMQIDQIHIFDDEGTIVSGTLPDFYGFTLYSGDQIAFFLPMLKDKNLTLIQDVMVNSGQNLEMQYIATWSIDKEYIVQIGIRPFRLMEAMRETELIFVFDHLVPAFGSTVYIIEAETGNIVVSTDQELVGNHLASIAKSNFNTDTILENLVDTKINEISGKSVFREYGEYIIGVNKADKNIYSIAVEQFIYVIVTGIILAALIIYTIYVFLDRHILSGLIELRDSMEKISDGDLDHQVAINTLPEFQSLSTSANYMVQRIIETSHKFSTIFEYVNLPIAIYERRAGVIRVTSKMCDIINLPDEKNRKNLSQPKKFLEIIRQTLRQPYPKEKDVFIYINSGTIKYLKIKLYSEKASDWGIIIDITQELNEKQNIKFERDIDYLTTIYNRRAFLENLNDLSQNSSAIKKAVLLMMDLDNLKFVNDSWGHAYGDDFIVAAAKVLKDFSYRSKIAARLSGDEFVILLYGADTYEELEEKINELHSQFNKTYILNPDNEEYPVSISGGYVFYPKDSENLRETMQLADSIMYQSKRSTKGLFKAYKIEDSEDTDEKA